MTDSTLSTDEHVDRIMISSNHYDIAILLHRLYKDKFKYYGKNHWKYYDDGEKIWKDDKKGEHLRTTIKTNLSDLFNKRYFYWYNLAYNTPNRDLHMTYMEKATYLLKISYNLKTYNFISTVIKEAKGFFDIYNDD